MLFREGLTRLLVEGGHEVIAAVGDADALVAAVRADPPDLAVVDVRMPPTMTDDGSAPPASCAGSVQRWAS
jgi:DNA-binding NarL/FixJ family response regulator